MTSRRSSDGTMSVGPLTMSSPVVFATPPTPPLSTPPSSSVHSFVSGSGHQAMEASLVDLMQAVLEYQTNKAQRKREEEEKRRKAAIAAAQAAAHAAALSEQAQLTRGVYGVHARTPSAIPHAHTHMPTIAPASVGDTAPSAAEVAATFSSFLSHFHLLSHLVTQLPITSLERLIQFLQPTRIEYDDPGSDASQPATVQVSGAIPYAFPLLDAQTQTQLIELLIKAYLQVVYLRERQEQDQLDEEEYWQRQNRKDESVPPACPNRQNEAKQAEGEPSPGEVASCSFNNAPGSGINMENVALHTSPSASSVCQLRLLRILRAYAGGYRLSYVIRRCVDYQNWLACAVAMECSSPAVRFTGSEKKSSRPPVTGLLLASGSIPDINLSTVADAMECRLKHMEHRLEAWIEWKQKRAADPQDTTTCPAMARSSVPLLLTHQLPSLPADVWLSFDEYAVETAYLFMQLVSTHLIRVQTISEQARLIALLMRGWREWDLPSLVLESIFLSHLASIADALSMLAFQKTANTDSSTPTSTNGSTIDARVAPSARSYTTQVKEVEASLGEPSHSMSTDGTVSNRICNGAVATAPIFSAKLYLALTHYRLNQLHRPHQSNSISVGVGGGGQSSSSSSSVVGSPPSASQAHRLWSEVLANLNRDLEPPPGHVQLTTNTNVIVFKSLQSAPAIVPANGSSSTLIRTGSSSRSGKDGRASAAGTTSSTPSPTDRMVVAFSCNHSFSHRDFFANILPDFFNAVASLTPAIPLTAKFLAEEYALLGDDRKDPDDSDDADDDSSRSRNPRQRVVSLACPSCVYSTLLQMHQRHEQVRQQAQQKTAMLQKQQSWRAVEPSSSWGVSPSSMLRGLPITAAHPASLGTSPSRSLTPTLHTGTLSAPAVASSTTFAFIQQNNAAPPSPVSPMAPSPRQKTAVHGLSMAGNIPKVQFGRVSSADIENA